MLKPPQLLQTLCQQQQPQHLHHQQHQQQQHQHQQLVHQQVKIAINKFKLE